MRTSYLVLLLFTAALAGCGQSDRNKKANSYSFACLDSAIGGSKVNKTLDKAGSVFRDLTVNESSITDEIQNDWGEAFHQDVVETGTFKIYKGEKINRELRTVMDELLEAREDRTDIKYFIYAVQDSMVNAFTFGGRIYVTTGMYEKCGGKTPLLYAIVGHEIGHSELGHIRKTIQEMMVAEKIFGEENGATAFQISKMITGSFNQRNELEADYYGTDLTNSLNHDVCAAVTFWKQMSKMENEYNALEDFFRTHPFSSLRAECLQQHIRKNFNRDCGD